MGQLVLTAADDSMEISLHLDRAMNYALAHNGVSPLKAVSVDNRSDQPLDSLQLELELDAPVAGTVASPVRLNLSAVEPHSFETFSPRDSVWTFHPGVFAQIDEAVAATVTARVVGNGHLLSVEGTMSLLAHNEWWALSVPESLAAFVTPRAPAIRDLLSDASALLQQRTGSPSLNGYQGTSEHVVKITEAIYDAMAARAIRYINPPPSFEGTGQKIRTPDDVLVGRWGTCLDLATTYAAALEEAGLNPILVMCEGHAFAGVLREEMQLPEMVLADRTTIQNYVDSGLLLPVETTALCEGDNGPLPFAEAVAATRGRWTTSVRHVIDVAAAHRSVRPLPAVTMRDDVRVVEVERPAVQAPPGLPRPAESATPSTRGALPTNASYPPRIDRWRNSLLDLSFRNPLLNMRTGRSSLALHVPAGALGSVEDRLFAGQEYSLLANDQLAEIHRARGAREASEIDPEVLRAMLDGGEMYVACPQSSYVSRLRGIARKARTVQEETGANNLYLTLGVLEWTEDKRTARSPMFLLPVHITGHRGRPFTLRIDDGAAAQPNQCLLEKLRGSYGLRVPEFTTPEADDSGVDLAGAIQAVRLALIDAGLPFAIEESASLALLQFSTLQLWQDLSDNWSTFMRNPVVRHLVETTTDSFVDPAAGIALPEGAEANSYCPIPFDSSQLEAVTWAQAGRSFVIEGPPGTGKSQTITNLIANAMANGKTVLFVAEKQAALDVVRRRLEAIGLGALCLNLHGKNQSPEKVRGQLRAALNLRPQGNAEAWESVRAGFRAKVEGLGRYPTALHQPGGAGLSAWDARQTQLANGVGMTTQVSAEVVAAELDTSSLYRAAHELAQSLYDLGTGADSHPWRLSRLNAEAFATRRQSISSAAAALAAAMQEVLSTEIIQFLQATDGAEVFTQLNEWSETVAESGWQIELDCLEEAGQPAWCAAADELVERIGQTRANFDSTLAILRWRALDRGTIEALITQSQAADRKLFKGKPRKAIIAALEPAKVDGAILETGQLTATLEALLASRDAADAITDDIDQLPGIAVTQNWDPFVPGSETVINQQKEAIVATSELVKRHPAARLALASLGAAGVDADLHRRVHALSDAWSAFVGAIGASETDVSRWAGVDTALIDAIRRDLPSWTSDCQAGGLVRLARWTEVWERAETIRRAGIVDLADQVIRATIPIDEIEGTLRRGIVDAALDERLSSPALDGFDGVSRDRTIDRFRKAGDELREDMLVELPNTIVKSRGFAPDRLVGRVGELNRELGRKRGGLRIRELFAKFGPVIAELTPCLMMSPSSVAQFIAPDSLEFDLVVFDEASQLRVAESIGAMGRGAASIIVGDSRQMPPTNVGSVTNAVDDDRGTPEELAIPADMDSVLSEAVESNLPRLWLSWHYRSKHEALIAFSNERYYENRLASFPRPPGLYPGLGVDLRRVEGSFERGTARVNRIEAAAIVAEIRDRLATDPAASIGVVTFNIQQRDLILDLLEESADERVRAALENAREPLFVKNLENVQGDERDVILFSLAFSPDPATGRLPLNFGPLVQAGGERRLNVAITRARAQVLVFSSFDPSDIELERTSSQGLADLRGYLEEARRGGAGQAAVRPAPLRDRHHDEVASALRDAGLEVCERVGLSDFTVDLGVAASSDGPWTAVFLDGPSYHDRKTVGDRESLPYEVLTNAMGWASTERVWLPDWLRSRDEVIERIHAAVIRGSAAPSQDPEARQLIAEPEHMQAVLHPDDSGQDSTQPSPEPVSAVLAAHSAGDESPAEPALIRLVVEQGISVALLDKRPPPGAAPFVPAGVDLVDSVEILDTLEVYPSSRGAVAGVIEEVLAQEAPIAASRLARIVARRFGMQRVPAKRAAEILRLVRGDQREATVCGEFVWASGSDPDDYAGFRVPSGDVERPLDEIAPRELINAMVYLARAGSGIQLEELLLETNHLFGYSRMAGKSRALLGSVVESGLSNGQLRSEDDLIHPGQSD